MHEKSKMLSLSRISFVESDKYLRFITLKSKSNTTVSASVAASELPGAILFLGADVVSRSSLSSNNYFRVHSRYAKMGLATKVNFKGIAIEGITNGGSLWFYSIQGLFKFTFEYLDSATQRYCLVEFRELWLANTQQMQTIPESVTYDTDTGSVNTIPRCIIYSDGREYSTKSLNEFYNIPVSNDTDKEQPSPLEQISMQCNTSHANHSSDVFIQDNVAPMNTDSDTVQENPNLDMDQENTDFDMVQENTDLDLNQEKNNLTRVQENADLHSLRENESIDFDMVREKSDVDKVRKNTDFDGAPELNDSDATDSMIFPEQPNILEQLISKINTIITKLISVEHPKQEILEQRLVNILDYFIVDFLDQQDQDQGYPLHLLEKYTETIAAGADIYCDAGCTIDDRKCVALRITSEWLGDEFSRLKESIDDRVEQFKIENIAFIADLPSPKILVGRLFPKCMVDFMLRWMSDREGRDGHDHSYAVSKDEKYFPFIQLILEFANTSLVSGMAHVLYAKLIRSHI